jgi:hypothetical protein
MPYYTGDAIGFRGDYYRGDYYRGDPGLFSFVGKALGGVAKLGTSVVRAGLGLQAPPRLPTLGLGFQQPAQRGLINIGPAGGEQTGIFNIASPGQPAFPLAPFGMTCPKGHRANKSTYITRGGGTSHWPRSLVVHEKGTVCVKSRRMNVGNACALRRSIRRVAGFAKLVKRSKRAISRAASAVGVHRGGFRKRAQPPQLRVIKAA